MVKIGVVVFVVVAVVIVVSVVAVIVSAIDLNLKFSQYLVSNSLDISVVVVFRCVSTSILHKFTNS